MIKLHTQFMKNHFQADEVEEWLYNSTYTAMERILNNPDQFPNRIPGYHEQMKLEFALNDIVF